MLKGVLTKVMYETNIMESFEKAGILTMDENKHYGFSSVLAKRYFTHCYFLLLQQLANVPNPRTAPIMANIRGIVYILLLLYFNVSFQW